MAKGFALARMLAAGRRDRAERAQAEAGQTLTPTGRRVSFEFGGFVALNAEAGENGPREDAPPPPPPRLGRTKTAPPAITVTSAHDGPSGPISPSLRPARGKSSRLAKLGFGLGLPGVAPVLETLPAANGGPAGAACGAGQSRLPPQFPESCLEQEPLRPLLEQGGGLQPGAVSFVGAGAFGRVFRVDAARASFAVKVLDGGPKTGQCGWRRELRCFQALAQEQCPATVRFFGSCEQHGLFVMEFLEGETLQRALINAAKTPLAEHAKGQWLAQVALALMTLHRLDYVHRDVSAANVLLLPPEQGCARCKLLDYGCARRVDEPVENESPAGGRARRPGFPGTLSPASELSPAGSSPSPAAGPVQLKAESRRGFVRRSSTLQLDSDRAVAQLTSLMSPCVASVVAPTPEVGMQVYMAPEVAEAFGETAYDQKCDLWALGVLCAEVSAGQLAADTGLRRLLRELDPHCPYAQCATESLLLTERGLRTSAHHVLKQHLRDPMRVLCGQLPSFHKYQRHFQVLRRASTGI